MLFKPEAKDNAKAADRLAQAVTKALGGGAKTRDLGGTFSTADMGDAVIAALG